MLATEKNVSCGSKSVRLAGRSARRALALSAMVFAGSLGVTGMARAQSLATWDFTGVGNPNSVTATSLDANVLGPVVLSGGAGWDGPAGWGPNAINFYSSRDTASFAQAKTQNKYFEFTLAPQSGFALNLSGIAAKQITQNRSRTVYVASSLDGYTNPITSATVGNGLFNLSLGTALTNLTSGVTLRLYYQGIGGYETVGFGGAFGGDGTNGFQVLGTSAVYVQTTDWVGGVSSDWGSGGNWSPSGVPAASASPSFGKSGANGNVSTGSSPRTVAGLTFAGFVPTTISGGSALQLNGNGSAAPVVVSGTHTISAPVVLQSDAQITANDRAIITLSGGVSQSGGAKNVTLDGPGTVVLSGGSTYTGTTTLVAGTLLATNTSGSATGTGPVVVNGGILGGSGIIGGPVTLNNGGAIGPHLSPTSTNTLTLSGGLTANDGGILNFNLGTSGTSDRILTTNLNLSGSQNFFFNFLGAPGNGSYQLLSPSGTVTDTATLVADSSNPRTVSYTFYRPSQGGNPFPGSYSLVTQIQTALWNGASGDNTWNTSSDNWTGPAGTKFLSGQPVKFDNTGAAYNNITVAGPISTSGITFDSSTPYTITTSDRNNPLTLDNGATPATISVVSGNHTITATGGTNYQARQSLTLSSDVAISVNSGASFTLNLTRNGQDAFNVWNNRNVTLSGNGNATINYDINWPGYANVAGIAFAATGGTGTLTFNVTNLDGGNNDTAIFNGFNGHTFDVATGNKLVLSSQGPQLRFGNPITGGGDVVISGPGSVRQDWSGAYNNTFRNLAVSGNFILGGGGDQDGSQDTLSGGVITRGVLGTGTVTLSDGALLDFQTFRGPSPIHNSLVLSGNVGIRPTLNGIDFTSDSSLAVAPTINLAANTKLTLVQDFAYGTLFFSNVVSGPGKLTIDARTRQTGQTPDPISMNFQLTNPNNTFSGGIELLSNGQFTLSSATPAVFNGNSIVSSALGTGPLKLSGGWVKVNDSHPQYVINNPATFSGYVTLGSGGDHYPPEFGYNMVFDSTQTGTATVFSGTPTVDLYSSTANPVRVQIASATGGFLKVGNGVLQVDKLTASSDVSVGQGTLRVGSIKGTTVSVVSYDDGFGPYTGSFKILAGSSRAGTVSELSGVSVADGGVFDINQSSDYAADQYGHIARNVFNTIVFHNSTLSDVKASVAKFFQPVNAGYTLAIFQNDAGDGVNAYYTSFGSATGLTKNDIIVRYTYTADTNVDGVVDGDDYKRFFEGYTFGLGGYLNGDLNNDGIVNDADLNTFVAYYDNTLPVVGVPTGTASEYTTVVPEPVALGLLAPAAVLGGRRRRTR